MSMSMKKMKEMFYAILNKEATLENTLKNIEKMKKSKIAKGYIHGMKNILISKKVKKYSINPKKIDENEIKHLHKMVKENLSNPFLPDFEKGYFIAWKDYFSYLKKRKLDDKQ